MMRFCTIIRGTLIMKQGRKTKGQVRGMEYRMESRTGNVRNWLNRKIEDFMALVRETVITCREEEIRACERAEMEAGTAAMFREAF